MTEQKSETKSQCLQRISTAFHPGPDQEALLDGAKALRIDQLDVAYLAIGANDALKAQFSAGCTNYDAIQRVGQIGQSEMIEAVVDAAAELLKAAFDEIADFDGNWYYEIAEPLGARIIQVWAGKGDVPTGWWIRLEIQNMLDRK